MKSARARGSRIVRSTFRLFSRVLPDLVALAFVLAVAVLFSPREGVEAGATQDLSRNASPDSLGGWTCRDGFVERAQSCIPVARATDAELRDLLVATSIAATDVTQKMIDDYRAKWD